MQGLCEQMAISSQICKTKAMQNHQPDRRGRTTELPVAAAALGLCWRPPKADRTIFIVTTESRGSNLHLGMEQGLSQEKGMEHAPGVPEAQHASLPSTRAGRCCRNRGRCWKVPRYRCLLLAPPSLQPRFFRKSNAG